MKDLTALDLVVITVFSACIALLAYNVVRVLWFVITKKRK